MGTIKRILIAFDLYGDYREESSQVPVEVRNALRLISDKQTAQIFLIGCGIEENSGDNNYKFEDVATTKGKRFCEILESRLQSIADKLITKGYQVTTKILSSHPVYDRIAQLSEEYDVDLVVQHVNASESSKLREAAYISWQLARTCRRPLLLVRDRDWQESPMIVTAVDPMPSYYSTTQSGSVSLYVACKVKKQLRGDLHVVHAYSESPWPFGNSKLLKGKHKKVLVDLLAPHRVAPEAIHLVDKVPLYSLSQYQEKLKPDIVIMDAYSKTRFTEAIIGNPAKRMLDFLQTDLLIIRQGYVNEKAKIGADNQLTKTYSDKIPRMGMRNDLVEEPHNTALEINSKMSEV